MGLLIQVIKESSASEPALAYFHFQQFYQPSRGKMFPATTPTAVPLPAPGGHFSEQSPCPPTHLCPRPGSTARWKTKPEDTNPEISPSFTTYINR